LIGQATCNLTNWPVLDMDTAKLKKFAQYARRYLMEQVAAKIRFVLAADSQARRENPKAVNDLERQITSTSQDQVIEKVAYIWFNRFCAIRFMDANRYTRIGILSPAEGQSQPEILAEAKMGHIDEDMMSDALRQKVFSLLNGTIQSRDPQAEAYQLLVVAACNYYNRSMPFMFEKIADYTELLIPDDLLSGNSILADTRDAMTPDVCKDVEVIGWLYQFYISEKKDAVFEGLKKNKKITPENIPAATQLFTPHWIVRYLVENSLGRLWMLNRPNSRLIDQMDYYIKPETPETDFLRIVKPEEIKLCDPASGSGHMLTYSYDVLYAIYEEEGYDATDIPRLILENNLFGIEIDERAGELAAFALTMKAAKGDPKSDSSNYRRFFRKPVQSNICILQNILFDDGELKSYMDAVGRDLFTVNLQTMLHQFREADNFGSLIRPEYADAASVLRIVAEKNLTYDLFMQNTHERVLLALKQADYLSQKYHVVVANPPYLGGKGMNAELTKYAISEYPDSKSDLFAMFVERIIDMVKVNGNIGLMTPFTWMFIKSYEKLRIRLLDDCTLASLIRPEYHSFFESAFVPICVFTLIKNKLKDYSGKFIDLQAFYGAAMQPEKALEAIRNPLCDWGYSASSRDFDKIPGKPIAYWVSNSIKDIFKNDPPLESLADARKGMTTSNDDHFLKVWNEVNLDSIGFDYDSRSTFAQSNKKFAPMNKGGGYRKWYGNYLFIGRWENDGYEIRNFKDNNGKLKSRPQNLSYLFKEGVTWNAVSVSKLSARYVPQGYLFNDVGPTIFNFSDNYFLLGYLHSKITDELIKILCPTMKFEVGQIQILPISKLKDKKIGEHTQKAILISKTDWDAYETSWSFVKSPMLQPDFHQLNLKTSYHKLRTHWQEVTLELQQLEEANNQIFIDSYALNAELTPGVPLNEITLSCNPHYRYDSDKCEKELEALLLADTIKDLISYSVGCMFGRYSLDKPGLILANQGETIDDYLSRVPDPTFEPDDDNVIPILDEGWFTDDITERFRKFLKITFGEEHYEENLAFLEEAIGKDIRKYFLTEFYTNHLRRYKKRPIYWLFSSPKGSFNALIYMHRYRPDTVSVVLNDYLREFRTKLSARKEHLDQISISASASPKEKTQALKDLEKLRKIIDELDEYERETLYPMATKQIAIDLDDGVKVNYLKFGDALKKIPGLDATED
jgi:type II restriction/modification system DNA methylase subunit YeeA